MRFQSWFAVAAVAALTGCSVSATTEPDVIVVPADGSVTIDWSIANSQDPFVCSDFGVDAIEITIYDDFAGTATSYTDACESFVDTFAMPEGDYSASAVLLDVYGREVSTTIDIAPFTIIANTDLSISIDFPPDSFF